MIAKVSDDLVRSAWLQRGCCRNGSSGVFVTERKRESNICSWALIGYYNWEDDRAIIFA